MTVSVKDVAALADVSVGTVSNVLNRPGKVAPATAERVLAAIEQLGFVRNDAARQLRAGRSSSIGLVVLDVRNPFFTDVARGAERRAAESGLDRLHRHGIPAVLVDRRSDDDDFSSVSVDDHAGGYLAVRHLLDTGRRRIAFVGGPPSIRQVGDRLAGARRAVAEEPDAGLEVLETGALTVLEGRAVGERLRHRSPRERPDAVFAANDLLAVGLLQALVMLGPVMVPDEIAIIGYDDIDFSAATVVPLSSIRQPSELIGFRAVELLIAEVEGVGAREQVVFQPELVVRESTAPRKPSR